MGVEYHKRFDRRALDARGLYRRGRFGEFRCGEAKLVEPYYYRHSNFQNWFTKENSDPFTYIGCHYVDLVYFITGLRPVEVSVRGVEGHVPQRQGRLPLVGRPGGLGERRDPRAWSTAWAIPTKGAGTNDQGLCMFCEGDDCGAIIRHDDQFRGVSHGYVDQSVRGGVPLRQPRLLPPRALARRRAEAGRLRLRFDRGHRRRRPSRVNAAGDGLAEPDALAKRQEVLDEIDRRGILATPANSYINELVVEAARLSIAQGGRHVGSTTSRRRA